MPVGDEEGGKEGRREARRGKDTDLERTSEEEPQRRGEGNRKSGKERWDGGAEEVKKETREGDEGVTNPFQSAARSNLLISSFFLFQEATTDLITSPSLRSLRSSVPEAAEQQEEAGRSRKKQHSRAADTSQLTLG